MAKKILSSTHVLEDAVGRVYASPQFVRADNVWKRIADVITVRADSKLPGFIISYKDSSITLSIVASQATVFKSSASKYQASWEHFAVSVNELVPDELQWEIKAVGEVSKKEDYWKFDELEGCDVGLHLTDWQTLFGDKMLIVNNIVTMDMTDFKKDMIGDKVLDPSTVAASGWRTHEHINSTRADTRGDGSTASNSNAAEDPVRATAKIDGPYIYRRAILRFDTRGIETFVSAAFFASQHATSDPLVDGHISLLDIGGGITGSLNYGHCFTAYTNTPIGSLVAKAGTWHTVDMTDALIAEPEFDLSFAHIHDVQNLSGAPAEDSTLLFAVTGDDAAYIEYQPPTRRAGTSTCPRRYGGRALQTRGGAYG